MQSLTVKKEATNKSILDCTLSDVLNNVSLETQISFLSDLISHYNSLTPSPKLDVMNARRKRLEYWNSEVLRMSQNL